MGACVRDLGGEKKRGEGASLLCGLLTSIEPLTSLAGRGGDVGESSGHGGSSWSKLPAAQRGGSSTSGDLASATRCRSRRRALSPPRHPQLRPMSAATLTVNALPEKGS